MSDEKQLATNTTPKIVPEPPTASPKTQSDNRTPYSDAAAVMIIGILIMAGVFLGGMVAGYQSNCRPENKKPFGQDPASRLFRDLPCDVSDICGSYHCNLPSTSSVQTCTDADQEHVNVTSFALDMMINPNAQFYAYDLVDKDLRGGIEIAIKNIELARHHACNNACVQQRVLCPLFGKYQE